MALGSSAPEILLNVVGVAGLLGKCPDELGPSTIVGSASFNLLVISGVSIYAVTEENDNAEDRDTTTPQGIKKINDMGVFTITAVCSVWAYVWLFIVVADNGVTPFEAWFTFAMFAILIVAAFTADKYNASQGDNEIDKEKMLNEYTAMEIYRELIREKQGTHSKDEISTQKRTKMKQFLKETVNTDNIETVDLAELKAKMDGEAKGMLGRIKYRKQVGLVGKQKPIAKGQILKTELKTADSIEDKHKNENFGFQCLHYSVSEASGSICIQVLNKSRKACKLLVKTVDDQAKAGEDYQELVQTLEFKEGEAFQVVEVFINDDENWEPDEDFWVQLYSHDQEVELRGADTKTRVTIIDDDKPGQIQFEEEKMIKAIASDGNVMVVVKRKNGSDGTVTVDYNTYSSKEEEHNAIEGEDYIPKNGTLIFKKGETEQTIEIDIKQKEEGVDRDEMFGL